MIKGRLTQPGSNVRSVGGGGWRRQFPLHCWRDVITSPKLGDMLRVGRRQKGGMRWKRRWADNYNQQHWTSLPPFFCSSVGWLLMSLRTERAEAWYCLSALNSKRNGTAVGSALDEHHSYVVHFTWREQCYSEKLRLSQKSLGPYKETI